MNRAHGKPNQFCRADAAWLGVLSLLLVLYWPARLYPADEATPDEPPITASDREHWAFRPIQHPVMPAVRDRTWGHNPVDDFILARLEAAGLSPLPPADRLTLIRRATFDLTGLPPTPAEVDAFCADDASQAYERLVDRLLAAPAYGERWAQHWLDLARFAETDGFEHDLVRPHAWRYRDWVVNALNQDLPYDEFTALQIAGDELRPGDPAAVIATGFLLCGPDMPDINLQDERRHTVLNEITSTVGAVFLGLQIGCAQCHDHKYDPLSQADFYRLRAHFDSADIFKDHPVATPAELAACEQAQAARGPVVQELEARLKMLEESARRTLREKNPDLQPKREDLLAALSPADRDSHAQVSRDLAAVPPLPPLPLGRVLKNGPPRPSQVMIRGDFRRPGARVEPGVPRVAVPVGLAASIVKSDSIVGRRSELARWLTRPENPLTTRVLVNRLWQGHFGEGLVRSASDFGRMGETPTHPELFDWLAGELPRQGWSLRRMHRLLVTSATYRQASRPDSPDWSAAQRSAAGENWSHAQVADPDNRLLARMPRRRLEGEAIRDAMLAAAGQLSQRRGGPGIRPPLPQELVETLLKNQWNVSPDTEDHRRRSLGLFVRRNLRYPLFEAFDRPDANASCPRRGRSTIAPQALFLLNSEFSLQAAQDLAAALQQASLDPTVQIDLAYLHTLSRRPTEAERRLATDFLNADSPAALTGFCLALFNLNEFIYID